MREPSTTIEISSAPLPDNRNYRVYSLAINGKVVRRQISAIGRMEVQTECEKLKVQVPAEWAAPVPSCAPGRVEARPITGRWAQMQPSQQQQAQARSEGARMIDDALKAVAPHVKPMHSRCCRTCDGSGYVEFGHYNGSNTSYGGRCSACNGSGMVWVEASK